MNAPQPPHRRATLVVACAALFVLGVVTSILGPVLPDLAARTGSGLAALGTVFTALFLGALLAQTVSGTLIDRWGGRPVLLGGLALLGVGVLGIALSRVLGLTLTSTLVAGIGFGAVDVSANVLVAETYAERRVSVLNILHAFFGAGAVVGPALAGLCWRVLGSGLPALYVSVAPVAVLVAAIPRLAAPAHSRQPAAAEANGRNVYRAPLAWALGTLLLLYVGIETGIGGWTTAYMHQTTGLAVDGAALVTSGFWLALAGGRILGAGLGARLAPSGVLWASLGAALAGGALLAVSTGQALASVIAILLIGLGFGPIFPTAIAITTAAFPRSPGRATSLAVAMGSIGGMLLPWLQGVVLEGQGPSASVLFSAAGILSMAALYAAVQWLRRMRAARRQAGTAARP